MAQRLHYRLPREVLASLLRGVRVTAPHRDAAVIFHGTRPLRIKYGIDPTRPELHLGYLTVLRKLKLLQDYGHTIVILIGDFTARFGDPTDKVQARTLREGTEITEVMRTYEKQIIHILDPQRTEFRYNSEWYEKMSAEDLLRLMSGFTVQQMLERDMFSERLKKHTSIRLHEPTYPVLQGFDSFQIKSDATIIGQDQFFNELVGRTIQERMGQNPQSIFGVELLPGTDGKEKMSQSLGNHIFLQEPPFEQYGKLMSIPDSAVVPYVELLTNLPVDDIKVKVQKKGVAARDAKGSMARNVVQQLYGEQEAKNAEERYVTIFRKKDLPQDIPLYTVTGAESTIVILRKLGIIRSHSEAEQLARQGGIRLDNKAIKRPRDPLQPAPGGSILRIGKRAIYRVISGEK